MGDRGTTVLPIPITCIILNVKLITKAVYISVHFWEENNCLHYFSNENLFAFKRHCVQYNSRIWTASWIWFTWIFPISLNAYGSFACFPIFQRITWMVKMKRLDACPAVKNKKRRTSKCQRSPVMQLMYRILFEKNIWCYVSVYFLFF